MIIVTHPSKPFQYTAKGTPRRHVSLAEYNEEIDALYERVEESSQVDVALPPSWTSENLRTYVRAVVHHVMKAPHIDDGEDLFQQGCDRPVHPLSPDILQSYSYYAFAVYKQLGFVTRSCTHCVRRRNYLYIKSHSILSTLTPQSLLFVTSFTKSCREVGLTRMQSMRTGSRA